MGYQMTDEERNAYAEKLMQQAKEMNARDAQFIVVYSKDFKTDYVLCNSARAAVCWYDHKLRQGAQYAAVYVAKRAFEL